MDGCFTAAGAHLPRRNTGEATGTAPRMSQCPPPWSGHGFQKAIYLPLPIQIISSKSISKPILNNQNPKINLFQKLPLTEKYPFTFGCLRIGQMNFCVTSQYVAEIEMKHENSANGSLKKYMRKGK